MSSKRQNTAQRNYVDFGLPPSGTVLPGVRVALVGWPEAQQVQLRGLCVMKANRIQFVPPTDSTADVVLIRRTQERTCTSRQLADLIAWTSLLPPGQALHRGSVLALRPVGSSPTRRIANPEGRTIAERLLLPDETPQVLVLPGEQMNWVTWHRPLIEQVLQFARRVAFGTNILIEGETGAGKSFLARAIHAALGSGPLVSTNGRLLGTSLIDSELFGYEPGAFTDAGPRAQYGKLELAHQGTLLIDEVDTLPLPAQAKLLRFLQDRTFERLGSNDTNRVDCTVIATSNRPLRKLVQQGKFRADLYARLTRHYLELPPLRIRPVDAIGMFLTQVALYLAANGWEPPEIRPVALARLALCGWPQNVRTVTALARAAVVPFAGRVVGSEEIELLLAEHLPPSLDILLDKRHTLQEATDLLFERMLHVALWRSEFNISQAARLLRVSRGTIYRLAARLGIRLPELKRAFRETVQVIMRYILPAN